MLKIIANYTMRDVLDGLKMFLENSSHSIEVHDLAVRAATGGDDPISSVFYWVKQNVTYLSDPKGVSGEIELFISPVKMAKDYAIGQPLGGDCDDMALLTTALLRAVGVDAHVMLLDTGGNGIDHAICKAYSDKIGWLMIDPSAPFPCGWQESYYNMIVV